MDAVQIRCPSCQAMVRLQVSALVISAMPRDGAPGRVAFACPACRHGGSLSIDDELLVRLRVRGCRVAPDIAARSQHPAGRGQPVAGAPARLCWDDLLNFHNLLEREDWFDQLLALVR